MATASRCSECGSSRMVEDELYSERQLVCEDCGTMVPVEQLTTTLTDETHGTAVPYHASTEAIKKPCRNLIAGIVRVRALCRILHLKINSESEAVDLFMRAYNHPNFLHVTLNKKELLKGCCVLYICRRCNWPVAMGTIGYLLGVDNFSLGVVYKELTDSLQLESSTPRVTQLLESFCHDLKLGPDEVDCLLSETPQRLVERSSALIELAAETWIVTGRQPVPLLMATVYMAWQSLNPSARKRYSFVTFCKIVKMSEESWRRSRETALKRVGEVRGVLCKLARALPWVSASEVRPNSVATLVDDILQHHKALLLRAVKIHEQQLEKEMLANQTTCIPTNTEQNPEDPNRASSPASASPQHPELEVASDSLPPDHWSKRHLFLPPCVKNSKRRRKADVPVLEVTGNEDISDSEIDLYIRSNEEVELYLKTQKKDKKKDNENEI